MSPIELEHLTRTYLGPNGRRVEALVDVSLSIARGELLVLAGPSGSGKTTVLRLIAGLEPPTSGTVKIGGQPPAAIPPREHPVAMVFQNPALYPEMNVWDNLAFGLTVRRVARSEIHKRVAEAAEVLGLSECIHGKPAELSGGERQRVALGRALVRRPAVLLLDEPLSSLDPRLRLQMRGLIRDVHARLGATTIYVTHDHDEGMLLAGRLAVLNGGRLEQAAPPGEVYNHPANLFVAGFVGSPSINLFPGAVCREGGLLRFRENAGAFELALDRQWPASLGLAAGRMVLLGVRPEHILLRVAGLPEGDCSGSIPGVIDNIESTGPETFLRVSLGSDTCIVRVGPGQGFVSGSRVTLQFEPSALLLFDAQTGRALPQ